MAFKHLSKQPFKSSPNFQKSKSQGPPGQNNKITTWFALVHYPKSFGRLIAFQNEPRRFSLAVRKTGVSSHAIDNADPESHPQFTTAPAATKDRTDS